MRQKALAVECLEKLDIHKPYINKFRSLKGIPCFFEHYAGFYVDQEPELWAKVKEVEKEFGCLVYAITHEITDFGECWSMLCVSKDSESIDDCLTVCDNKSYYAYSYVWNKTADHFSEFGDVVVKAAFGGVKRIY